VVTPHTQSTPTQSVPRGAVLDAWSGSEWDNGLQIDRMGELTTVAVRTARSVYEITILNGHTGDVLVRGGGFFPERTPVQLTGSTFGGSILKRRGIYVGMRLEFVPQPAELVSQTVYDARTGQSEIRAGHRVIWTSLIQSVEVVS